MVNPGHAGDGVPRSHYRRAATTRHHIRRAHPDHRQRATPTVRRPRHRQDRNSGTHPEMVKLAAKTPSDSPPMPLSPQVRAPRPRSTAVVLEKRKANEPPAPEWVKEVIGQVYRGGFKRS